MSDSRLPRPGRLHLVVDVPRCLEDDLLGSVIVGQRL